MKFTTEELEFIKLNHSKMTIKEIAQALNKDPRRVSEAAISLGLRKYPKRGTKVSKRCEQCGQLFFKGYRESRSHFSSRRFCSVECFREYMKEHRNETFPSNIHEMCANGRRAEREAYKLLKNEFDFLAKSVSICDYIGVKDNKIYLIEIKYKNAKLSKKQKKAYKVLGECYKVVRIS